MVKKIESWQASDGVLFADEKLAIQHESFHSGVASGIMQAIVQLETWAEMGAGGNLTKDEIQISTLWKNAQMLREHFKFQNKI